MAYECSTSSPTLTMVVVVVATREEGWFLEASLGSAQEMDGSGGKMISQKNKRSNANVAGVKGKRASRRHGGVGDADDAKVEEEAGAYDHVRAGWASHRTESHNVPERLRREMIRKKMKMLRSLVPGCDKLTGKVLLDEIIGYVQSLQSQLELATLNPTMVDELGLDIGSMCHPDALQVVKMAEMHPHELVRWMGQATDTASLAEDQGATRLAQDGSRSRVIQQVQKAAGRGVE